MARKKLTDQPTRQQTQRSRPEPSPLYQDIVRLVQQIPAGRVATYGQLARLAGKPRAARTVSYILHSSSRKLALPWQRVINSRGTLSLPRGGGYERQKQLLKREGVRFDAGDRIDLNEFGWQPTGKQRSAK